MVFNEIAPYNWPMNQFERDIGGKPAVLEYLDGEYRVITSGAYVVCAVTGVQIGIMVIQLARTLKG